MKKRALYLLAIVGIIICGNVHPASAVLDWQDEVDVQFTFNPALSVSISEGDIVIPNLGVGTRDDSNEITITVGTNNVAGYQLSATVGNNTTYDTRNLKHDTSATALFSSIDIGSSLAQLTTPSTWGYSTNSGTSYSGLPKYDDTTNVAILNDSDAAGTETTNFLIGAYADQSQLAGDYRNVINFNVVTNVVKYTIANAPDMQSVAPGADGCPSTLPTGQAYELTDSRDGEAYKVARLADGKCWMLDNLALDLVAKKSTLTDANTNASTTTLNYLKNGGGSTSDQYATDAVSNWTSDYSYSAPLVNMASKDVVPTGAPTGGSGSNKVGGYYNFCAASAGSYCYGDGTSAGTSSGNATEDICPKGWRMPTGSSSGEYQNLYTEYSSDATNFRNALSTPLSGLFNSGSARLQGSYGYFWSATYYDSSFMYRLYVSSSLVNPQSNYDRYYGNSVRCVLSS